jgi:hypothetical protein
LPTGRLPSRSRERRDRGGEPPVPARNARLGCARSEPRGSRAAARPIRSGARHDFHAPFPNDRVHLTSIFSRGDGVVLWQRQIVPYADCVEVTGSHVGLAFNRKSYRAIADALATPELQPRLGSVLPESRRAA